MSKLKIKIFLNKKKNMTLHKSRTTRRTGTRIKSETINNCDMQAIIFFVLKIIISN